MSISVAAGLSRKLKKVLETRTDTPELLASLSTLSTFYTENSLQTRRNLRTTIERLGLKVNEEFLSASEAAQQALDVVEAEVQGLAECCDSIQKALNGCTATTGDMVVATERLRAELANTTRRQELVANFLHNYQLTADEIAALREEDLDERFFEALSRVQEIHANCKILLRTHHQRAGLELMDVMAVYQEGAYERLCRWVQAECRSLGDSDTPEVSDLLKKASLSLRDRPVLFKYCAEEVANTRHNALFRRFISALTRGGPGGMPRPIEVHAHDPMRYVGDMLAWLHQALASERELVMGLFSSESGGRSLSTSRRFSEDASITVNGTQAVEAADMASVLDRVFEGVCRPFRVRVEQVLTGQPGLLLAYKLANLLAFYASTISELLGEDAALSSTLGEVKESAQRAFHDIIKARGDKLLRYPPPVTPDLSPPPAVSEGVAILLDLIETHQQMMVAASDEKPDFEPAMAALLDPLIVMCERAAEGLGGKAGGAGLHRGATTKEDPTSTSTANRRSSSASAAQQPSLRAAASISRRNAALGRNTASSGGGPQQDILSLRHMFLVNCLAAIQQPLVPHPVAAGRVASLGVLIEVHLGALVEDEVTRLLERCSLSQKLAIVGQHRQEDSAKELSKVPLANIPELSQSAVSESLRALFALLAGSEGAALPEFEQIQPPRLRSEACTRVANALADAYREVYDIVLDANNGYKEPRSMLRHTPQQMKTILGI